MGDCQYQRIKGGRISDQREPEKKVTIEDAENIAETFNMMVKNAGAKDIEDYKNKSSVFFCSPLEK